MAHQIISRIANFDKSIKKFKNKYKNIAQDLKILYQLLENNPFSGDEMFENCYKLRLKNSSTNKGKGGGFRVVYYVVTKDNRIYLIDIYSKSDQENIEKSHLLKLLKDENINQ
ncbi:MAG: hypothetical protein Ctma_1052 [Catillopecten margaritatus gill symbiont]|uniref:Addiction module toxin RelE n=1 Tax=Catillopecten margaritatus gill symbiont TaxID=3083288 RepID=A0AAU6PH84_9GAMM